MKEYSKKNLFFPEPVLILGSYDENGNPDAMNAAWGGRADYELIAISLADHKSTRNFLAKKVLTIAFADEKHVDSCDYVGIVSMDKDPKKMEKSLLKTEKAPHIDAPIFTDLPINLECAVEKWIPDEEGGGILIAKILHSFVSESALDEEGKLDIEKAGLICLDEEAHLYRKVGSSVAKAFSAGLKLK